MNKLFIFLALIAGVFATMTAGTAYASNDEEVNLTGGKLTIKKADDITINISGAPGPAGPQGPPGNDGQDGINEIGRAHV